MASVGIITQPSWHTETNAAPKSRAASAKQQRKRHDRAPPQPVSDLPSAPESRSAIPTRAAAAEQGQDVTPSGAARQTKGSAHMSGGVCTLKCRGGGKIWVFEEVMAELHLHDGDEVDHDTMWRAIDLMAAFIRAYEDTKPIHNRIYSNALDEIETVIARRNAALHGRN